MFSLPALDTDKLHKCPLILVPETHAGKPCRLPVLSFTKSSTIPDFNGPGLYIANKATISSKLLGAVLSTKNACLKIQAENSSDKPLESKAYTFDHQWEYALTLS